MFLPHLILSFVAQVGLAQGCEEKVFSWPRFQSDPAMRVCIREITLQAWVFRVVDQDDPIHVVGVALRILDKLKGEVEAGPEDVDGRDFSLEGASPVHGVRGHRLVRHLVGLACNGNRSTRPSFKIYRKVGSAGKKSMGINTFENKWHLVRWNMHISS